MRSVIQTRSWRIMRDLRTRRNIGPPPGPPLASGRRPALGDGRPAQNLGSETRVRRAAPERNLRNFALSAGPGRPARIRNSAGRSGILFSYW